MPDGAARDTIAGCDVQVLPFCPGGPIPALRAEWALRLHGLPPALAKAQIRKP